MALRPKPGPQRLELGECAGSGGGSGGWHVFLILDSHGNSVCCLVEVRWTLVPLSIPFDMASMDKILEQMRREPTNVRFADLQKVCEAHFGAPRQSGSSHAIDR